MPFAERHPQSTYLPPRPVGYVPVAGGHGPTAWHCLHCGKRNLSTAKFCGGCAAPSRLPAEFLESLEARNQAPQPSTKPVPAGLTTDAPAAEKQVGGVITSVATFTTISVIQQIDPPEPKRVERVKKAVGPSPAPVRAAVREEPAHQTPALVSMQVPKQVSPPTEPALPASPEADRREIPPESVVKKPARRKPAPSLRHVLNAAILAVRTALAGFPSQTSQWFVRHAVTRRSLAVGAVSVLILCALWPMPTLTAAKNLSAPALEGGKPVFWDDMQTYVSNKLGLSISDTELLARAAWGDIPSLHLPMTCERALAIESVINQRGSKPLIIFPNIPFRGPLLDRHLQTTASAPAPFSDVPLDHPLYDAWRPLLTMDPPPPVALPNGKACPYEVIRWEEWQALIAAVWRSCRPGRTPPEEVLAERSGTVSGDDADRSIRALGEGLGVKIGETPFLANPRGTPSRMETLAALSRLLADAQKFENDGV